MLISHSFRKHKNLLDYLVHLVPCKIQTKQNKTKQDMVSALDFYNLKMRNSIQTPEENRDGYSQKGFEWIEAGPLLWESDNWAVAWRMVTCRSFMGWERAFMLEVRQALKALFHLSRWWGCYRLTWTLATWYNLCFRNILALMWGRGDRKVMMAWIPPS